MVETQNRCERAVMHRGYGGELLALAKMGADPASGKRGSLPMRTYTPQSLCDHTIAYERASNLDALVTPVSTACERIHKTLGEGPKKKIARVIASIIPLTGCPAIHSKPINCASISKPSTNKTTN